MVPIWLGLESAEDYLLVIPVVPPLALQERHPQLQVQDAAGDLGALGADDVGHLGVDGAVDHGVHGEAGDIHGDDAVEGVVDAAEGQRVEADDNHVNAQAQPADGQLVDLVL